MYEGVLCSSQAHCSALTLVSTSRQRAHTHLPFLKGLLLRSWAACARPLVAQPLQRAEGGGY